MVQAGQKVAGKAADAIGDEAANYAEKLWERLRPGSSRSPPPRRRSRKSPTHPEDEDALGALRIQLRKLLEEDRRSRPT